MHISYQWILWAYSSLASRRAADRLQMSRENIFGLQTFSEVWKDIEAWHIWVLPIENSYAGSIHENLYGFLRVNAVILWEIRLPIHHCLLSTSRDISTIQTVYSHQQALSQCHNYLHDHTMTPIDGGDTAISAQMVANRGDDSIAAIASELCSELYGLHILDHGIQDQSGNTTRFFVIQKRWGEAFSTHHFPSPSKVSILFQAKNLPAVLYKCLGAFATNGVNLTKIESLPSLGNPFSYTFWIDLDGNLSESRVRQSLEELTFFTERVEILGEYALWDE